MSTYIYWIHYPEHTDPMTEGYIGVSKSPMTRYRYHSHPERNNNTHLYRAMQKGCELTILEEFASAEQAYKREEEYRPTDHIGFNIIPGGGEKGRPPVQWGHTHSTNKGQKIHSDAHKAKMSERFSKSRWYTDGVENKRLPEGEQPEGWVLGVTRRDKLGQGSR